MPTIGFRLDEQYRFGLINEFLPLPKIDDLIKRLVKLSSDAGGSKTILIWIGQLLRYLFDSIRPLDKKLEQVQISVLYQYKKVKS